MTDKQLAVFIQGIIDRLQSEKYEADQYTTIKSKYEALDGGIDILVSNLERQVEMLTKEVTA